MRSLVAGGAGFIGSHLVHRLVEAADARVTVYDNFSSGKDWHLSDLAGHPRLSIIRADIQDLDRLTEAMPGHDRVFHLASNPDIAKAMVDPTIDFWEGTYLTQNVLEAMRRGGVGAITYASGSGVYGETGLVPVAETYAPMEPISTYGASKLAGEAMISAYCRLFGFEARVYRFANVVGPRQTHGVGFDFICRLRDDPARLRVLGDGTQSKSYIYIDDVLDALLWPDPASRRAFECYNIATDDYVTVTEVAGLAMKALGLSQDQVTLEYSGGDRGWKGDVPIVRFDLTKIHSMGWKARRTSRQALWDSMQAMVDEPSR